MFKGVAKMSLQWRAFSIILSFLSWRFSRRASRFRSCLVYCQTHWIGEKIQYRCNSWFLFLDVRGSWFVTRRMREDQRKRQYIVILRNNALVGIKSWFKFLTKKLGLNGKSLPTSLIFYHFFFPVGKFSKNWGGWFNAGFVSIVRLYLQNFVWFWIRILETLVASYTCLRDWLSKQVWWFLYPMQIIYPYLFNILLKN